MNMLTEEELTEAVDIVCMTLLDMPVSGSLRLEMRVDESMDASIEISGAWQGSVQVRASQDFLRVAASRIFLKEVDEVDRQDCIDTVAELTNMLGGTIKCLLPESCSLGLPEIVTRDQHATPDDDGITSTVIIRPWLWPWWARLPTKASLHERTRDTGFYRNIMT